MDLNPAMRQTLRKPVQWVVGLTGGIGSGKTAVSNRLHELGATVIDTDEIAHSLTQPDGLAIPSIRTAFGDAAVNADGSMNRNYMRGLVFKNPDQRVILEKILHPLIRESVQNRLDQGAPNYFLIVVPLLFEKGGWNELMDEIVVVDCPIEQQVRRVIQRNNWTEEQVLAVINNQASRSVRIEGADHVIENTQGITELIEKIDFLHRKIIKKAQK
ncbi:dephospho-CoA kinase [Limnobacter parvus]|uniref:Dephospho-CoA kinase n=1 Tax=Limnobacter parvus TaxID=2939690 RepID=A0ABT1XII5_9BURK|nr:dephospho-CoA kinase [Limnobacter parvus]MCR2746102.1 dephospho-CoA kinase [Limnobacter parvus]